MIIHSAQDMISFGEKLAEGLVNHCKDCPGNNVIELVGDIGVGKTTLVKGIAKGLGITDEITSPSFTISKTYRSQKLPLIFTHLDFYRLTAPGIMQEELKESIASPDTITIIEWASTVKNLLPKTRSIISIHYNDDNTRTIKVKK
jgi:tRNA threonylcarbamoyladenosine biosynthesis protein TsaE